MKHLDYKLQEQWRDSHDVVCQSPINLSQKQADKIAGHNLTIKFDRHPVLKDQLVGEQFMLEGELTAFNKKWALERFHFHEHSEHLLNGNYHDLEVHFVFKHQDELLVVALLGDINQNVTTKFNNLFNHSKKQFDWSGIFPKNANYYSYLGSLTTPPFTKTVRWVVMDSVIDINYYDLKTIKNRFPNNYRRLQETNQRTISYHVVG